jgi:hypothetical protein
MSCISELDEVRPKERLFRPPRLAPSMVSFMFRYGMDRLNFQEVDKFLLRADNKPIVLIPLVNSPSRKRHLSGSWYGLVFSPYQFLVTAGGLFRINIGGVLVNSPLKGAC